MFVLWTLQNRCHYCGALVNRCRLAVLGLVVVAAWVSMVWLLVFTVKEARRQKLAIKRRQEAAREGGTALALARELQDK